MLAKPLLAVCLFHVCLRDALVAPFIVFIDRSGLVAILAKFEIDVTQLQLSEQGLGLFELLDLFLFVIHLLSDERYIVFLGGPHDNTIPLAAHKFYFWLHALSNHRLLARPLGRKLVI